MWFIEVCRRIRLKNQDGHLCGQSGNSNAPVCCQALESAVEIVGSHSLDGKQGFTLAGATLIIQLWLRSFSRETGSCLFWHSLRI